jgi:NHLM bacteriocin system ABC transporter ATP-binding protein
MATTPDGSSQLLEPQPNHPFSIEAADSVWIVQSGKLDLFLLNKVDGEPAGARHHFLRVEHGRAVFGIDSTRRPSTGVIATATPGTQLLCLSVSALRRATYPLIAEGPAEALSLLEDWILNLAAAAATGTEIPKFFADIESGAILDVTEEPRPVGPVKGILWVEHLQGTSRFLHSSDIDPIGGQSYFPVSRRGWLQPGRGAQLVAMDSRDWQRFDPEWRSLQTFHDVILQRLILNLKLSEEKSQKRLQAQGASDAAVFRNALRSLGSPLEDEDAQLPVGEVGIADPTLLACEAVGKYLGVPIVAGSVSSRGSAIAIKDVVAGIARASDLRHRVVVLKGKWWINASGPLLAFRDRDTRPVALLPAADGVQQLYDPVEQRTTKVDGEIALALNGFAYTFYRPLPSRKLSIWDLLSFGIRDARRELLTIVFMGVCGGLLAMLFPIATGIIFDSIIPGAQRGQLLQICAFLVIATIAASMFTLVRNFAMLRLEGKMGAALQAAVWDRLLRLPVPFFRRYTSGDLADRSSGIGYILRTLTGSAISSILSGVFSIFSFLLLFYYSWQLALIATSLVFVIFVRSAVSAYFEIRFQRQIYRVRGRISGMLLEFIGNIARLRVSGAEPRAFAAWAREFSAQKKLSVRAQKVSNGLAIFNSAFPVVSMAILFSYAAQLMGQPLLHALTTGTFLAFLAAFVQFQSAALGLSSAVESALGVVPLYERATPIFEALPEVSNTNRQPGDLSGAIEMNHVSFRYHPDSPLVLRDISFAVKPGQFVAIVGPSGSGKSSLLRLLLGFERPEAGVIYYDGQDLADLDIQAARRQIGVVLQSARLGSGTIFDNIVGSGPFTLDDAWEAARSAGLEQDIREMPMGMHTVVSEGGGNISGGQRQRLLIARAMVKKPRIFLFDEATSALDNRTQATVSHSLDAFSATRVVIAHRLSTIVHADLVLVVEKGIVVQSGSYEELSEREGLFRELAKRQLA